MRAWLLALLRCPQCGGPPLVVAERHKVSVLDHEGAREDLLDRGVLACPSCSSRFPVLDEAPRLVPAECRTEEESRVLSAGAPRVAERGPAPQMSAAQAAALAEDCILEDYGRPTGGPGLRRARDDIAYQRSYARRRATQLRNALESVPRPIGVLYDIGGGSGGNARAATEVLRPRSSVVADLSPRWPGVFQTGDRSIAYVRARSDRLPFQSSSADLVLSSFLLEHVQAWRETVLEMTRVGRCTFVAFGPNRRYPFEFGHIDAPLAHCLPPRLGAASGWLWGRLRRRGRSYRQLRQILGGMNYVSSHEFYEFCDASQIRAGSLLEPIVRGWAGAGTAGVRGWLRGRPRLIKGLARSLESLGMEPNVYALLARSAPPPGRRRREK